MQTLLETDNLMFGCDEVMRSVGRNGLNWRCLASPPITRRAVLIYAHPSKRTSGYLFSLRLLTFGPLPVKSRAVQATASNILQSSYRATLMPSFSASSPPLRGPGDLHGFPPDEIFLAFTIAACSTPCYRSLCLCSCACHRTFRRGR